MGGATSVMSVTRDTFSQQAADTTDRMVRCDWLQVAIVASFNFVNFIAVVIAFYCNL